MDNTSLLDRNKFSLSRCRNIFNFGKSVSCLMSWFLRMYFYRCVSEELKTEHHKERARSQEEIMVVKMMSVFHELQKVLKGIAVCVWNGKTKTLTVSLCSIILTSLWCKNKRK